MPSNAATTGRVKVRVRKGTAKPTGTSLWVGTPLPPDARKRFAHIPGLDDDLHMTLLYLLDVPSTSTARRNAQKGIERVAASTGPIRCKLTGIGRMVGGAMVAYATVDDGAAIYTRMLEAVNAWTETLHNRRYDFLPHVTLKAEPEGADPGYKDLRLYKWTARELHYRFGEGPVHTVKLTGEHSPRPVVAAVKALIRKGISDADQADCDRETERIKASRETPEARRRHKFRAAKWTHKNGHPRCRVCGDSERIGGTCEGYKVQKAVSGLFARLRKALRVKFHTRKDQAVEKSLALTELGEYMTAPDGSDVWIQPLEKSIVRVSKATQTVRIKAHPAKGTKGVKAHIAKRKKSTGTKPAPKAKKKASGNERTIAHIPLTEIQPDAKQHREDFDEAEQRELMRSLEESGQQTSIQVWPIEDVPGGDKAPAGVRYQIIGGERRWRAMSALAKHAPQRFGTIAAEVLRDLTAEDALTLQIIENLSRKQPNVLEEANAYRQMYDQRHDRERANWKGKLRGAHRHDTEVGIDKALRQSVADRTGKQLGHVTRLLKLTWLDPEVQEEIKKGHLSPAHGEALFPLAKDPPYDIQEEAARGADHRAKQERRRKKLKSRPGYKENLVAPKQSLSATVRHNAQMKLFRKARADKDVTSAHLRKFVVETLAPTLFGGEQLSGDEKQVMRQEQKAKLDKILDSVVDAITEAWDEKTQSFATDALTATDIRVIQQKIDGAQDSFDKIRDSVEQTVAIREGREARKRVVRKDPEQETTGSLFTASLSRLFARVGGRI